MNQQGKRGLERRPRERTRQSSKLYKVRLAGCYLVIKDHNALDFKNRRGFKRCALLNNNMDFKCLLWFSSNEHVMNLLV